MRSHRSLLLAALMVVSFVQPAPAQLRRTFVTELTANRRTLEQRHDSLDRLADSLEANYVSGVRLDSMNAAAALRAHRDSLVAFNLVPHPRSYTPPLAAVTVESMLGFSASAVLWANDRFHFDVDPGGYKDRWRSMDKLTHAALAYGITDGCSALGGRAFVCAAIVTVGGMAYEGTQGTYHSRDAEANAIGAVLSAIVNTWVRR